MHERRSDIAAAWAWLGAHDVEHPDAARLFGDVSFMAVPLLLEQTADEVNRLLRTTSYYQRLTPAQREGWERDNVTVYERLGRPIRSSVVAVLVAASLDSRGADDFGLDRRSVDNCSHPAYLHRRRGPPIEGTAREKGRGITPVRK